MRPIGRLASEMYARRFSNYLYVQGIRNQVEAEADGRWVVWVYSEDKVDEGKRLLDRFEADPEGAAYSGAEDKARARSEAEEKDQRDFERRFVDVRARWRLADSRRLGPVTLALMAGCVGVVAGNWVTGGALYPYLYIEPFGRTAGGIAFEPGLPAILHGEVWRLVTPIFVHFGFLHLLFNLFWLNDLGSLVEKRQGWWMLLVLVLAIAVASNLAQYALGGPAFGGMSGVVYGLAGYVWMRGRFDPASGLYLPRTALLILLVWGAVCLTGILGPVANAAHGAGLATGMAAGLVLSGRLWRRRGR